MGGEHEAEKIIWVEVAAVVPSPYQPRRHFDAEKIDELAASIRQQGLIQPIVVREVDGGYELIAGERRLRAVRLLRQERIPAIVRRFSEEQALEAALVENLQREDISVVEVARAYQRLAEEFHYTQGEMAQRTGKSRVAVSNSLRLLQLPEPVLEATDRGELSEGHARCLLALPYASLQVEVSEWVVRNAISVRELERKVRELAKRTQTDVDDRPPRADVDTHVRDLEDRLRQRFGTKVTLAYRKGSGKLELEFYNDDDLQRILELLGLEESC